MRSIGWAMTWEYWRMKRWYILLLLLVWIIMSYLLGLSIKYSEESYLEVKEFCLNHTTKDLDDFQWAQKQLEQNEKNYKAIVIEKYYFFLFFLIFSLGSTVVYTKKNKIYLPERMFTLPLSTRSLVTRIFLNEMIFITILSFILTGFFVFFSEKTVSIIGIGLFTTTTIITIQSFLWLAISAPFPGIPLLLVVSLGLFLWFAIQHQFLFFSGMDIIWEKLEPDQAMFMLFCMILSYIVAVKAVSLDRVKENLSISELNQHLDHKIRNFFLFRRAKFKSPSNAHFWFVWQRHGFLMPLIILFFIVELIVLFSVATSPAASISDIFNSYFFFILFFLSTFWGTLIAKSNPVMAAFAIGTFEATRPISCRDISYAILKNGVVNIFLSGIILIFSVILGITLNYFLGNSALIGNLMKEIIEINMLNLEVPGIRGLIFVLSATLILSWIFMAISSVFTLTGDRYIWGIFWMVFSVILFIFYLGYLSNELPFFLEPKIFYPVLGKVLILEVIFIFIMAKRRNLIKKRDLSQSLTLWAVGSIILILICYTNEIKFLDLATYASAIMALALAPFALAPITLHWNRHR